MRKVSAWLHFILNSVWFWLAVICLTIVLLSTEPDLLNLSLIHGWH